MNTSTTFELTPKQAELLVMDKGEVIITGSCGAGKSVALVADAINHIRNQKAYAILMAPTHYDIVRIGGLKDLTRGLFKEMVSEAGVVDASGHWYEIPALGSKLILSHAGANMDQCYRYAGCQFTYVGLDHLPGFTQHHLDYMNGRLRGSAGSAPAKFRCTLGISDMADKQTWYFRQIAKKVAGNIAKVLNLSDQPNKYIQTVLSAAVQGETLWAD